MPQKKSAAEKATIIKAGSSPQKAIKKRAPRLGKSPKLRIPATQARIPANMRNLRLYRISKNCRRYAECGHKDVRRQEGGCSFWTAAYRLPHEPCSGAIRMTEDKRTSYDDKKVRADVKYLMEGFNQAAVILIDQEARDAEIEMITDKVVRLGLDITEETFVGIFRDKCLPGIEMIHHEDFTPLSLNPDWKRLQRLRLYRWSGFQLSCFRTGLDNSPYRRGLRPLI